MEETDNNNEIGSKEDKKNGSDCEEKAQQSEALLPSISSEKPDGNSDKDEGEASGKEQEKASEQLELEDTLEESLSTPAGKDTTHQDSDDSQNTIELNDDQNARTKVGPGSISLSTLISTIIKGTVAGMDDVGKDKASLLKTTTAVSLREIMSSSELQDGALSSPTDNQTCTIDTVPVNAPVQDTAPDTVLPESGGEIPEETVETIYTPAAGSYRGGRGRRGRMQQRFTMSWNKQHEEANEVAQTKTIDTDRGRIYQCVSCNVSFNFEQDMRMHLQTHLRPRYFCPVCSRRFLNQSTLERHVGTHDQSKPHVCSICSQGFRIKSNLNRHYQRIHNAKVDIREPKPTKSTVAISQANMAAQDDHLADPNLPTPNLGKTHAPTTPSYASPYPYRNKPISTFAAPRTDLPHHAHYEPTAIPHEPSNNVVSSTELIADAELQSPRSFEYEQSPYLPDPDHIEPNDPLSQRRAADDDESYERLFFSRYPDVESAVDAIRRIETERLFHQELLLEELKLRRKYGLPSNSVLDDLKKEIAVKERIEDLDSLVAQGSSDFGRSQLNHHPNGKPVHDPDTLTESLQRTSPHPQLFDASFQRDRSAREEYLMAELQRRQENEEIPSRSIPSDLLHHEAQESIYESQASTQLRRLSGYNPASQLGNKFPSDRGGISDLNFALVQPPSSQLPGESSANWSASQRLKALTPPFGRARRGRRRLAVMDRGNNSALPPKYTSEPDMQQQRFSAPPKRLRSPAPLSQVVHHRPMLPRGSSQALPPPPNMIPPPLPFRAQRNPSLARANLPPPPDYRFPSSPRYFEPKRFRPTLQPPQHRHKIAELQNVGSFSEREERDLEVLRAKLGTRSSQPTRAPSTGASPVSIDHTPNGSNPFTMNGPPNQSIKPVRRASAPPASTPHTLTSEDCSILEDAPSTSKQTNGEGVSASPLDLSQKS